MKRVVLMLAVFWLSVSQTQQAKGAVINTIAGWNGTDAIFSFGEPNTATYGQTITVGADNVLNSFTFLLDQTSGSPVKFQAYVMAWDDANSRATGPVLYSSAQVQTTGVAGFETFTFNTGALVLTPGDDYVLFLNASNNFDSIGDAASMASRAGSNVYSGGLFVFLNNGNQFSNVTTSSWTRNWQGPGYDTAFQAEFSAVPEPSSLAMFGLMGVGAAAYYRRRKAQPV